MTADLPAFAAWRFVDLVDGFEVVYAGPGRLRGHTCAVQGGVGYAVDYHITFDERWRTREVRVSADTVAGTCNTHLLGDGESMDGPSTLSRHRRPVRLSPVRR